MMQQAAHELVSDLEGRLAAQVTAQLAAFEAQQNERVDALQQAVAKQTAAADDAALKLAETACHFQEVKARYLERGGVLESLLVGQKALMDSLR